MPERSALWQFIHILYLWFILSVRMESGHARLGGKAHLTVGDSDVLQCSISRGDERKMTGLVHETCLIEESLISHGRSKPRGWIHALHAILPEHTQCATTMRDRVHDERRTKHLLGSSARGWQSRTPPLLIHQIFVLDPLTAPKIWPLPLALTTPIDRLGSLCF